MNYKMKLSMVALQKKKFSNIKCAYLLNLKIISVMLKCEIICTAESRTQDIPASCLGKINLLLLDLLLSLPVSGK